MKQNDLYRAAHNIKPDAGMKARLAAKTVPEPETHGWARTVGTLAATCMLAGMIWGVTMYLNTHQAPEETSLLPGADNEPSQQPPEATEAPTVTAEPQPPAVLPDYTALNGIPVYSIFDRSASDQTRNSIDYQYLDDEFTPLQSIDEIIETAREMAYAYLWERFYPELYSRERADDKAEEIRGYLEQYPHEPTYPLDELEYARTTARFFLALLADNYIGGKAFRPSFLPESELPYYDGTNGGLPVLRYKWEDVPEKIRRNWDWDPDNNIYESGMNEETPGIDDYCWFNLGEVRTDRVIGYSHDYRGTAERPNYEHNVYLFFMEGQPPENTDDTCIIAIKKEVRTSVHEIGINGFGSQGVDYSGIIIEAQFGSPITAG
jgi:hypothetical protein